MWNISIIQKQSTSRSFPRKTILQRPYWQSSEWTSILHYLANWCLQNTDLNLKQKSTTKWSIQRTDYPPHCGQIDGSKSMICPGRYHQERSSMKTFFRKNDNQIRKHYYEKTAYMRSQNIGQQGSGTFLGASLSVPAPASPLPTQPSSKVRLLLGPEKTWKLGQTQTLAGKYKVIW